MTTLLEMSVILKRMAAVYNQKVDADKAKAYTTVLGRYPRMVLVQAAIRCMEMGQFLPKPAELIQVIKKEYLEGEYYADPTMETTAWVCFRNGYSSYAEITEQDCREIFPDHEPYVPVKVVRQEKTQESLRKAWAGYANN